jgi:hypothetical protein
MTYNFAFEADAVGQHTVSCCGRAPRGSTRRWASLMSIEQQEKFLRELSPTLAVLLFLFNRKQFDAPKGSDPSNKPLARWA